MFSWNDRKGFVSMCASMFIKQFEDTHKICEEKKEDSWYRSKPTAEHPKGLRPIPGVPPVDEIIGNTIDLMNPSAKYLSGDLDSLRSKGWNRLQNDVLREILSRTMWETADWAKWNKREPNIALRNCHEAAKRELKRLAMPRKDRPEYVTLRDLYPEE